MKLAISAPLPPSGIVKGKRRFFGFLKELICMVFRKNIFAVVVGIFYILPFMGIFSYLNLFLIYLNK